MNLLAFVPFTVESDTTISHSEPAAGILLISTQTITSLPSVMGDIGCRDTVASERRGGDRFLCGVCVHHQGRRRGINVSNKRKVQYRKKHSYEEYDPDILCCKVYSGG